MLHQMVEGTETQFRRPQNKILRKSRLPGIAVTFVIYLFRLPLIWLFCGVARSLCALQSVFERQGRMGTFLHQFGTRRASRGKGKKEKRENT